MSDNLPNPDESAPFPRPELAIGNSDRAAVVPTILGNGPQGPVAYLLRLLLAHHASPTRPRDNIRKVEGSGMMAGGAPT